MVRDLRCPRRLVRLGSCPKAKHRGDGRTARLATVVGQMTPTDIVEPQVSLDRPPFDGVFKQANVQLELPRPSTASK